jgi:hypothetical protein
MPAKGSYSSPIPIDPFGGIGQLHHNRNPQCMQCTGDFYFGGLTAIVIDVACCFF